MYSSAIFWRDGKRVWSITRDSQRGSGHLETEGILPPVFVTIFDRLNAKQVGQNDEDAEFTTDYIFDVPIEVAKALTGFRHDESIPGASDKPYETLERYVLRKKWWQLWR